jgi:hypothetical protein
VNVLHHPRRDRPYRFPYGTLIANPKPKAPATAGSAPGRIKDAAAGLVALAVAVLLACADEQGFLDFIHSQGVPSQYPSTPGADYSNRKVGEMTCDVFHHGGTAADIPFLGWQQNNYRDVLIDGARRFLCPDTLGR